jgi:phosphoenolpyruvate-protein kinase (PTS system EI component)
LAEAQQELLARAEACPEKVETGIMVEIPSVVQMADLFACEVDFFSIGTNDLTQYTFAVDRTNPNVAALADACHPAVLRQIRRVVETAHQNNIWVGICGELAGDLKAIPILLGLGVDELSMSSPSISNAKALIRSWTIAEAEKLAAKALEADSAEVIRTLVKNRAPMR